MASHIGAPSNRINYHHKIGSGIHCTPDNFGKEMVKLFEAYSENVVEGITQEVDDTSNIGVQLLQMAQMPDVSESGNAKPMKRRVWKKYSRSWYVDFRKGNNFCHATIANKKHYRLTHLLEYGHYTRNGTKTRAFRHIEPVDIYCTERLEKNIPIIIQKGGEQ